MADVGALQQLDHARVSNILVNKLVAPKKDSGISNSFFYKSDQENPFYFLLKMGDLDTGLLLKFSGPISR